MLSRLPFSLAFLVTVAAILTITTVEASSVHIYPGRHHKTINPTATATPADALCKQTGYPSLCASSVGPVLSLPRSVSPADLTTTNIQATIVKTIQARSLATNLINSHSGSKIYKANINVCLENYDATLDSLRDSIKTIRSNGSHDDLMINLSAALTGITTCDDAFTETPGMASPLAQVNSVLGMLAKNCLELANMTQ
ncbi:hypothetical protein QJS04_geneDACA005077 [Acorus gramineus]|uniref:Pectinesterase inhibitor domain-containing protein n=1 Tax=Acorus gramineus TaxID=55184 RepID=A0AAV9AZY5_ACOGR|nr:hypothetical protein QJS04_geneDACA005077 [Acorus gramineus]